jgi:hypothetical protein
VIVHFTPTHASWMNLVEVWFSVIERQAIRRGTFGSVRGLNAKIRGFIDGGESRGLRPAFPWLELAGIAATPVFVRQVQAEQEHGGEHADRRDRRLVKPDRVREEKRQTGAAENAVDGRDGASAGEQQGRCAPAEADGRHLRCRLPVPARRIEELFGLRNESPIVAADLLNPTQELDVLEGVSQQRDEREFTQNEERGWIRA